jgi:hypothetical protein
VYVIAQFTTRFFVSKDVKMMSALVATKCTLSEHQQHPTYGTSTGIHQAPWHEHVHVHDHVYMSVYGFQNPEN